MWGKQLRHKCLSSQRAKCRFEILEDRRLLVASPLGWQATEPVGSLVYQAQASGTLAVVAQRDEYVLDTDPGQVVSLLLTPSPALRASVELRAADGRQLAVTNADNAGVSIRFSTTTPAEPGPYQLVVTGLEDTSGDYSLRVYTNANLEVELPGESENNSAAAAENLDALFQSLGAGASTRAAVVGDEGEDWFRFSLSDGQLASITLGASGAASSAFEIYDAQEQLLAVSALEQGSFHVMRNFVDLTSDGAADDYFVRVAPDAGQYSLMVVRGAGFEQEPNGGRPAGAQPLGTEDQSLGYVAPWTQPWREAQLLLPDAIDEGDLIGQAVALNGGRMLVGAPGANDEAGAAFLYRRLGDEWQLEQQLVAPDAGRQDDFGSSVAIDGNLVVVGADRDDEAGSSAGAAYVFRFDGTAWVFEQKLLAADGAADDRFGRSVAVRGDVVAVGAPLDDDRMVGVAIGAAYLFQFDGATWQEDVKIQAFDTGQFDLFGTSVALSDEVLLVGAEEDDDTGTDSGSVDVYRRNGDDWEFEQNLTASDGNRNSFFGHSLAIDEDVAIIGAPGHSGNNEEPGAAYVFRFDGAQWNEEQLPLSPDSAVDDQFGASVAINGDRAIVGAPLHDEFGVDAGAVYAYSFIDGAWILDQKLAPLDSAVEIRFGGAVAIAEGFVAAGTPGRRAANLEDLSEPLVDVGGTYVFSDMNVSGAVVSPAAALLLRETAIDLYSFSANMGDVISISTSTPTAGAGDLRNRLDASVELLDSEGRLLARDTNGEADGRNAQLEYEIAADGEYLVRVWADEDAGGEYLLSLDGSSAARPALGIDVTQSFPGSDASVQAADQILIAFEQSILLTSLSADDLNIDGEPAVGFEIVDGKHVLFQLAGDLADGAHRIEFSLGALSSVSGATNDELSYTFYVDSVAPRIVATSLVPDLVLDTGVLTFTLGLDETNRLVGFATNGNPIFEPGFVIDRDGLRLVGEASGSYDVRALVVLAIDEVQATIRLTFRDLQIDNYTLTIVGGLDGISDLADNPMDGEVASLPIPVGGSGDGVPGGDFVYHFSVAADGPVVAISSPVGMPGETVTSKISLSNLNNVSAFDFDLAFDTSLLDVASLRLGSAANSWTLAARIDDADGTVTGSLFNFNQVSGDGGEFLEIDFLIAADAPIGAVSPLDLARVSINEAAFPALVTDGQLRVSLPPFQILSATAGASVIDLEFDRAVDTDTLRLFGDTPHDEAVAHLAGTTADDVSGSLIWEAARNRLSFVPTGGPLAADSYRLIVRSGEEGIAAGDGAKLDGDADGLAGGDFVLDFVVEPTAARTVAVADFARGPGQSVDLGGTAGLPIRIDEAEETQKVEFQLIYDPALLEISGATAGLNLPADWQISQFATPADGVARFTVEGTTPLAAGPQDLLLIIASVPMTAAAGSAHLLRLEEVRINDDAIAARGDSGVHLAAFVGDTNKDGMYQDEDALRVAQVSVGLATGFGEFPAIDPVVVADVTRNGTLSSLDAAFIARKGRGLEQPEIPDLPGAAALLLPLVEAETDSQVLPPPPVFLGTPVSQFAKAAVNSHPSRKQSEAAESAKPRQHVSVDWPKLHDAAYSEAWQSRDRQPFRPLRGAADEVDLLVTDLQQTIREAFLRRPGGNLPSGPS